MQRQVDAAHESHRIVDDDHLLVVRTAGPVVGVQREVQARVRGPELAARRRFALEGIDEREVPAQ